MMFEFKNETDIDPKVREFVAELISVCEKHGGELSGQFSAYIGRKRLFNIASLDEAGVTCWGNKFDPLMTEEKP